MNRQLTRLEVAAKGDKWEVREHGIGRLTTHPTKDAAAAAARAVAALHTPCDIIIRKEDGTVESEQSYHGRS